MIKVKRQIMKRKKVENKYKLHEKEKKQKQQEKKDYLTIENYIPDGCIIGDILYHC